MLPFFFLLVLLLSFAPHYVPLTTAVSTHNRRVLHESFFPIDTPPPTQPLIPSPPPPIQYPFQPSTPDNNNNNNNDPFFPTDPSPPPPLSPSSFVSFPANISSIILPKNSKSKPISLKLIAITITSVLAAIIVLSIAIFLHFKKRHPLDSKTQTSDNNSNGNNQNTVNNSTIPKLQRPSQTSSEFLYLGTIVSSHGNIDTQHNSNNQSTVPTPRKIDSPELRPLPPLNGRNNLRRSYGSPVNKASRVYAGFREGPQNGVENNEDFYSTEDSIGGGSLSRRDFGTVEVEKFVESSSGSTNSDSSLSSCTGSPNRSVSLSISPPVSLSPKRERESLRPKSPELVAVETTQPPQYPPPPPPPPAFRPSFVESVSPSPVSSLSPERYSSRSIDSSPRISNVWDQNLEFPVRISSHLQQNRPVFVPPPPHPPPPPPPPPPAVLVTPLRPNAFKSPIELSSSNLEHSKKNDQNVESQSIEKHDEINEEIQKPKLKTLHWDKVRASSDREMVWDQLKSSSFKLNEEMIETLFVAKASNLNTNETARKNPGFSSLSQENRVLDPKKSQNIAILLRALNVTTEEVCEALLEGNAETLGSELLESLLKMAPSKEEERKLKEYKDDSPFKLGPAEKFLKALVDIPFAFKRVDAMLYISNFDSEVDYLRKSFETLEVACEELRSSRMFLKLLEAVLKTGNRMNVGTNRGDAHAFKLDTLLKLVDVKGADGKTTLLHFVVQEIIKREGSRLSDGNQNQEFNIDDDTKCRKLGLQVVSNIGSELINVKNAATMDSEVLHSDLLKLSEGMGNITEVVRSIEAIRLEESSTKRFSNSMNKFMRVAEEKIIRLQAQETVAMSLVKEITEYFHGDSSREEARPLRIFMVVKDFLMILDRVCKEVGLINERSIISSAHKLPVPVNPNLQPVVTGFSAKRQHSFSDEESSSP